jgi:hypothetical protein
VGNGFASAQQAKPVVVAFGGFAGFLLVCLTLSFSTARFHFLSLLFPLQGHFLVMADSANQNRTRVWLILQNRSFLRKCLNFRFDMSVTFMASGRRRPYRQRDTFGDRLRES